MAPPELRVIAIDGASAAGKTTVARELADAIDATTAGGSTALHTALYVSLKEFGRRTLPAGDVRRQAIAVLSDGEDTAGSGGTTSATPTSRTTLSSTKPCTNRSTWSKP